MNSRHARKSSSASPASTPAEPPKWKLALLAWAAAFPLIYSLGFLFQALFPRLNPVVRTMLSSMILISGLTFFIMPLLSKIFSRWLMK